MPMRLLKRISKTSLLNTLTNTHINNITPYSDADKTVLNRLTCGLYAHYKIKKNVFSKLMITESILREFDKNEKVDASICIMIDNKTLVISERAGSVELSFDGENNTLDNMTLKNFITRIKVDRVVNAGSYGIPVPGREQLSNIDLQGADLSKANLTGASLAGVNLTGVNLTNANLTDVNLNFANLTGVNLTGVNLIGANLTGVSLAGFNLIGVNLTGANLMGTNLTGVNLTGANLTNTNLTGANLTGANLTGVNLAYADLKAANLTGVNLTGFNLTCANLTSVNLTYACLTGANLTGANLTAVNLTGANLTSVNLTSANLIGANLTGVNLAGASLTGANLTDANLTGVSLAGFNLTGVSLMGVNMEFAKLEGASLMGVSMINANLKFTNLKFTKLIGVSLTGANLTGANLTGANLAGINLTGANLTGVSLTHTDLVGTNLTDTTISLSLPNQWDEATLDKYLNHLSNGNSLFMTINRIDESFLNVKIKLMHQIIGSINQTDIALSTFNKNFLSCLNQNYLNDNKIRKFLTKNIFKPTIIKANTESWIETNIHVCDAFLKIVESAHNFENFTTKNNGFFIQLILNSISSSHENIINKANSLYGRYLSLERIKPYTQQEDFGDYGTHKVNWANKNACNCILVCGDKTIIISVDSLSKMLNPPVDDIFVTWNRFFLYDEDGIKNTSPYDLEALFKEFKIFDIQYQLAKKKEKLVEVLNTITLTKYHNDIPTTETVVQEKTSLEFNHENKFKMTPSHTTDTGEIIRSSARRSRTQK